MGIFVCIMIVAISAAINKHALPNRIMVSSILTAAIQILQTLYAITGSCPICADWYGRLSVLEYGKYRRIHTELYFPYVFASSIPNRLPLWNYIHRSAIKFLIVLYQMDFDLYNAWLHCFIIIIAHVRKFSIFKLTTFLTWERQHRVQTH